MGSCKILGIPIQVGDKDLLFQKCLSLVGQGGVICTPNPLILSRTVENAALRKALLSADLCIPDGSGLLPFLHRSNRNSAILPGIELGKMLVNGKEDLSIGIVGAKRGIAERAFSFLAAEANTLHPAFLLNGYDTALSVLLAAVKKEKPDLCFVCLGSPRQELLMQVLRAYSEKTLFLGLGGSLDVYAGSIPRAPRAFRVLHLEWLYRMCREPRRFRELPTLLRFPFLCAKYREENNKATKNRAVQRKN